MKWCYLLITTITRFVLILTFLILHELHLREKKNPLKCARSMARTVQLLRHDAYPVLLMLKSMLLIANEVRNICHSYDLIKDFFDSGVYERPV